MSKHTVIVTLSKVYKNVLAIVSKNAPEQKLSTFSRTARNAGLETCPMTCVFSKRDAVEILKKCFAEAGWEWRGQFPRPSARPTQLQRNIMAEAGC